MESKSEFPTRGKRTRKEHERDEEEILQHLNGKMNAAKLRIAEAEKARGKKLKAIRKEKKDMLKERECLLKTIAQRDTALAKRKKRMMEKDSEIEATSKELTILQKEIDEMVSELDLLDNTVTSTEVLILLRHLLYKITPRGGMNAKDQMKDKIMADGRAGQEDCPGRIALEEFKSLEPEKLKTIAEKVLVAMKQEIDECDAVIYPQKPDEKSLGHRGSFYFAAFPEHWPDRTILGRIEIETEEGKELVVPISTNGACMSEKMFSLLEAYLDNFVETFKSVLERKKKGKKTVVKKFSEFMLDHDGGRGLMEKVTNLYIKGLIPPDLVSWLRKDAVEKSPYSRKIMEAITSHSETAFGTALFENDVKMTKEEEKGTTNAFVSALVTSVEKKALKKWDEEVIAKCAQRVYRDVGILLTDSCLRTMVRAATMYDEDFEMDKSVWKSLEVQDNCDKVTAEEREGYSDEEELEEEELDDSSFSSGIKKAVDEFDLVFDSELNELEEKFDFFMSQSELS